MAQVAIIPVVGTLTHRPDGYEQMGVSRAYQSIGADIDAAVSADVDAIVFDVDSAGGEIHGAFDLADRIKALPVNTVALIDGKAEGEAYVLAAAADTTLMTQTSHAGSLGLSHVHLDRSEQLKKAGVSANFVYAGDRKIDGNQAQPLSSEARAEIQKRIDGHYDLMVKKVAAYRGVSESAVKATDAQSMGVDDAINIGLADGLATMEQAQEIAAGVSSVAAQPASTTPQAPAPVPTMPKENSRVQEARAAVRGMFAKRPF